jgi:hypothetical protein
MARVFEEENGTRRDSEGRGGEGGVVIITVKM